MTMMNFKPIWFFARVVLISGLLASPLLASEDPTERIEPSPVTLKVSYLYLGERWVSPPAFAMTGPSVSVKLLAYDADGQEVGVNPTWTGDPDMVEITPSQGPEVTITALKPGRSDVTVTVGNVSRRLAFKGVKKYDVWRVGIADRSPVAIKVAYRLDPRITRGAYMGGRWISKPDYKIRASRSMTVSTVGLDAKGKNVKIHPVWSGDPDMVEITPAEGPMAQITVLKEGQSDVLITSQNLTKKLRVTGAREAGAWNVEIAELN